jgi:hypothetical protein
VLPEATGVSRSLHASDKQGAGYAKPLSVTAEPQPALIGVPFTVTVDGEVERAVTGGSIEASISLFGVRVYSETDSLCEAISCPVEGDFKLSFSKVLPGAAPSGSSYSLRIKVVDEAGALLFCVDEPFAIAHGPAVESLGEPVTPFRKPLPPPPATDQCGLPCKGTADCLALAGACNLCITQPGGQKACEHRCALEGDAGCAEVA